MWREESFLLYLCAESLSGLLLSFVESCPCKVYHSKTDSPSLHNIAPPPLFQPTLITPYTASSTPHTLHSLTPCTRPHPPCIPLCTPLGTWTSWTAPPPDTPPTGPPSTGSHSSDPTQTADATRAGGGGCLSSATSGGSTMPLGGRRMGRLLLGRLLLGWLRLGRLLLGMPTTMV